MKKIAIISSYNPSQILLDTIDSIKKIYSDFDIVIIDSDSAELNTYDKLPKEIKVHLIKNKNYEWGAWKKGYELYPNYDIYMCIQDSFPPLRRADVDSLKENDIMACKWKCGFGNDPHCIPEVRNLLKNTKYENSHVFNYDHHDPDPFYVASHTFLITNKKNLCHLFETLPNLPTNKLGSRAMERVLGIAIAHNEYNWICISNGDIDKRELKDKSYFKKIHLRRS
jgi:hypothetical protein